MLNELTKDELVSEAVLLYNMIDWQETEIEKRDKMITAREKALEARDPGSRGFPYTEVAIGALAGALAYSLLD